MGRMSTGEVVGRGWRGDSFSQEGEQKGMLWGSALEILYDAERFRC